jgi:uncharacterized damage-inducible protein DinB
MSSDTRLQIAREQIEFARRYTQSLLKDIDDSDWFRQPGGCVTHVAWQVGHLAMAEYGLALFRLRDRRPEDAKLMSASFRKQFIKGSTPDADPANNPTPAEIRATLDRVHTLVLSELSGYSDEQLDAPVPEPYAVYGTKLGALFFCAAHEMMHAGQIGLLRRLLGKTPVR